jgi:hypothetical protein
MLMLHELHNWLLFMLLKPAEISLGSRPIGRCQKQFRKRLSIPQGFPQAGWQFLRGPQMQLPAGLTEANLGSLL